MEKIVVLNEHNKEFLIKEIEDIIYLESLGNKTKTVCCEGEFLIKKCLSIVEEKLPDDKFFKIHKSFIINIDYLKGINLNSSKKVLLKDGIQLNIAHRKYKDFMQFIKSRFDFW